MERPLPQEKQELVTKNTKLVNHVLKSLGISPTNPLYEELYAEGLLWLVRAARGFNEDYGCAFSTYAIPYISGCVKRYRNEKMNTIRIPRRLIDSRVRLGRGDTISESDARDLEILSSISSLEYNIVMDSKDNSESTLQEIIADPRNDIKEFIEEDSMADSIEDFLSSIGYELYRNIYADYIYSLYYDYKMSQVDLAKKYGLSQAQVSRVIRTYHEKFKTYLKNFYLD